MVSMKGSGRVASIALPFAPQCIGRSRRAAETARSRWPAVTWSATVGRPAAGDGEFDAPGAGEDSAVRHGRSHPADILQRLDDPLHGRPGQPGLAGETAETERDPGRAEHVQDRAGPLDDLDAYLAIPAAILLSCWPFHRLRLRIPGQSLRHTVGVLPEPGGLRQSGQDRVTIPISRPKRLTVEPNNGYCPRII
jgi:hypothetical protein